MFEQSVPTQVWQRAKQSPTQFNSNKNKPKIDYKEVAWVPPLKIEESDNVPCSEGEDEPTTTESL